MGILWIGSDGRAAPRETISQAYRITSSDDETTTNFKALLKSAMMRARRRGYWFGLSKLERSLYSLALRVQVSFKSVRLLKALVSILRKLKEMGDESYLRQMDGARLAWTYSEAAVAWGNLDARNWRNERNYILFLGSFFRRGSTC